MSYRILPVTLLAIMCCCAPVTHNSREAREISTVIPCETPSFILGDRVSNAELAVDIAEYILAVHGFDCRDLTKKVSFFEGNYIVSFRSDELGLDTTYTVDIDADTSRIHGIKILRSRLVAIKHRM
jgi:hypothetical protein